MRKAAQYAGSAWQHPTYAATGFPDRIVASPAQDASAGFAAAWRTDAGADTPLKLLYFGDTQDKNLSLGWRVIRQAWRTTPDAKLALFDGDLVSGGDGQDDSEWAEWFEAGDWPLQGTAIAPTPGNHEYHEEFQDRTDRPTPGSCTTRSTWRAKPTKTGVRVEFLPGPGTPAPLPLETPL